MHLGFAFLAGLLTTLSPCVLPVLPFITASSLNKNRLGPIFLALGLLISFVAVSLLVSSTGQFLGIDPGLIRKVAALFLVASGVLFLSQKAADYFSQKMSGFAEFATRLARGRSGKNPNADTAPPVWMELMNGALLGIVWTPCSGPSLGAALGLAAQAGGFTAAATTLTVFGLGSVVPILGIAYGTRKFVGKIRNNSGKIGFLKKFFGTLIVILGLMTFFDLDRGMEAFLTGLMPEAWINFVTKF